MKKNMLKPGISNAIGDIPNIPFNVGEYVTISSLTCQELHQKLEVDLSREQKMILQCGVFCSLLFLMFKNISVFHFPCQSSFNALCIENMH